MKRVCVVGAGAIGSCIGARLSADPAVQVSAIARGETLAALNKHGWRLQTADGLVTGPATASTDAADLGPQDLVVVAVKAQALPALAPALVPLIGPHTVVLPAMNGVPWWFGHGLPGDAAGMTLEAVDPGAVIARVLPSAQVVGCVVHMAVSTTAPGLAVHRMGQGLILGEPNREASDRLQSLHGLLSRAGFEVTLAPSIHHAVWYKLWGNVTMNPISALTGATADRILDDPLVRNWSSAVMNEVAAVGARIGCAIDQAPEDRHAITRKLGAFKTSMLQDAEAGRSLELDAIVGAVREIAAHVGVATPQLDGLFGLARLMGQSRGLYPLPA